MYSLYDRRTGEFLYIAPSLEHVIMRVKRDWYIQVELLFGTDITESCYD